MPENLPIINKIGKYPGAAEPGGPGGPGPPLELRFYRVKIFKIGKISFFVLLGPPLGKNRSQAPAYMLCFHVPISDVFMAALNMDHILSKTTLKYSYL